MNRKAYVAAIFVAVLCLLTSGCFSIEQEIFLKPDGSGEMVMCLSMLNSLEEIMKDSPNQDQLKLFDEFKQKFANDLPPTIKLKEAKVVQRHGANVFYIVLHFNQLSDVNSMIDKFAKEGLIEILREFLSEKHKPQSAAPEVESLWRIQLEKAGDQTVITQRFYADIEGAVRIATEMGNRMSGKPQSDSPPTGKSQASVTPKSSSNPAGTAPTRRTAPGAKPVAPKEVQTIESAVDAQLDAVGKIMGLAFFTTIKLRFVLHAPKKITETNADIVLDEKTAVWNASYIAFFKEKKPIEMKLIY